MCTLLSDSGRLALRTKDTTDQNVEGLGKYEKKGKIRQAKEEKGSDAAAAFHGEAIDQSSRIDTAESFC